MADPDDPIPLEDEPVTIDYARSGTRPAKPDKALRPHSMLAVVSWGMLFLSCAEDTRERASLPPGADSWGWTGEGSAQLFRDHYSADFAAALAAWGIVCGLIAILLPRTKKWVAVAATVVQALWLCCLWKWL
jgi:hypothetical protein